MAKVPQEQLHKSLKPLKPVYLISGDEPLLVQEACDAVRAEAKKQNFLERELFHVDAHFQWPSLLQSANSMNLFAEKKLLEVRLSSGKLNEQGNKALQQYCASPADDNVLLIVAPKLERATQNSKWFKALDKLGIIVTIWPINAKQLPRWIEQRMQRAGLKADSQAIDILASRVEGNLLAAAQEIEKLKLICEGGMIDRESMANAVVDSARYNVFSLIDKALGGQAQAAAEALNGLRGEGSEPTVILWAITRELRTLLALQQATEGGQRVEHIAKRFGVFDSRLSLVRSALQRLKPATLQMLIRECGHIDRAIKGAARSDPWATLLDVVLTLSGTRTLSGKVLRAIIKS